MRAGLYLTGAARDAAMAYTPLPGADVMHARAEMYGEVDEIGRAVVVAPRSSP